MILEGFEIANWSCVKNVKVSGLPPTGVIVLHGPNRTGKSSIVQALRACLMDYPSTSTALKTCYPRGTGDKPVVSVTFRAGGTRYRITKHFGSSRSELARQTPTGDWRIETTSAAEAHDRTCELVGGSDSTKGLHQLLWLTQAEFRLPDARKFDASVQAQLRGVLGVLQTPLDDRFIERVRKRWNVWYSGQRKAGKQPSLKDGCQLAENLKKLAAGQAELQASENRFLELERLLRQAADLEQARFDLNRQKEERDVELTKLQEERRLSQARILARQCAETDYATANKEQAAALAEQQQRADAASRWREEEKALEPARTRVESATHRLQQLEQDQIQRQNDLGKQRDMWRELLKRAACVAAKLRALDDAERLKSAQDDLRRAREIADAVATIATFLSEHPVPDKSSLEALKANRQKVARLQADRDAASMSLTILPDPGAGAAQLALDGGQLRELPLSAAPALHTVRRKAELHISGWGRVEFSRGTGQVELDQIEDELRQCNESFSSAVASFGIAGNDPSALDQLVQREAEHRLKTVDLDSKKRELKKLAPQGLEPLQAKVMELTAKLKDVPGCDPADLVPLPAERSELEGLAANLRQQVSSVESEIEVLDGGAGAAKAALDEARRAETAAKEELAACAARAKSRREELDRLRTEEQISQRIEAAKCALKNAETQLKQTELTNNERTIDERLSAGEEAVRALQRQIDENTKKYHEIKGRLIASEGLHAQRASLAARVDELTRVTDRESLEKEAIDRLYALFEECREKQLGALLGPIHDRVLGWMRVLDIGDYKEVRFNDAFLPDKLMSRDGTAEFTLQEESTGAQEQIGMLTRLALGSILASAGQPAVAVLDDPLTHCDVGRLNKMRVILRRAAEGDPNLTPPAGPLQIIVLTCHPEWFRDERAMVIDLENPEVMSRWAV